MPSKRKRAAPEDKKVVSPLKETNGAETEEMQKQQTEEGDRHLKHSREKKRKNESLGGHTMSRCQYYEDVLCAIGNGQSTSIDDDFPPFVLEKSDDFPKFVGFFLDEYTDELRQILRAGYEVYFAGEIGNGTMKHYDEELEHQRCLRLKAT